MAKKRRSKGRKHHHRKGRARRRSITLTGFRKVRLSNPSFGGMFVTGLAGMAGASATALVATKLLGNKSAGLRALGAVGVALLGGFFARKRPQVADAWVGSSIGTIAYGMTVNATGGVVATNKADALALTAKIPDAKPAAATPPAQQGMGVLLPMNRRGMGVLYNNQAARNLTGMGAATPVRSPINPRALLG